MMAMVRVLALVFCAAFAMPAFAQQDAAAGRSTAFQAVQGARAEDNVPGGKLLISAYGVVLVLLVGYVLRLGLLQRKTSADVARLTGVITRSQTKS
jgi:hypothetical protein